MRNAIDTVVLSTLTNTATGRVWTVFLKTSLRTATAIVRLHRLVQVPAGQMQRECGTWIENLIAELMAMAAVTLSGTVGRLSGVCRPATRAAVCAMTRAVLIVPVTWAGMRNGTESVGRMYACSIE